MNFIFFISILLAFSLFIETYGFLMRALGKEYNANSFGYSAHVQLATLSRIGTFIGLPMIAYLIDSGMNKLYIFLLPILTFFFYITFSFFAIKFKEFTIKTAYYCFKKVILFSKVEITIRTPTNVLDICFFDEVDQNDLNFIKKYGITSFIFTSGAFFVSSIIAQNFHSYRATILQLTPFISFIGTMTSVMFFDPKVSLLIDRSNNPIPLIFEIFKIRLKSALILIIMFLLFFFLNY